MIRRRSRVRSVLIHATLITVTVVTLFPVALVVRKSLSPGNEFQLSLNPVPQNPTLDHYEAVLSARDFSGRWLFGRQLWNSFVVALLTTILGVFLASTAAYAFSRFRFPGRKGGMMVFLVVQMFPATLIMIPLYVILSKLGLLNTYTGVIFIFGGWGIPFAVWIMRGFFQGLPQSLEDLAQGAGLSWHRRPPRAPEVRPA